jgi:predicted metal-dependent hydrolase
MGQIIFGHTKIKYEIRRGKRKKTIALLVQPNTSVIVLSPQFLSEVKIKQIVLKKAKWIIQKQDKIKKIRVDIPKKEFVSGESFPYLGRQYRLKITRADTGENAPYKLIGGRFVIEIDRKSEDKNLSGHVRKKLAEWYRARAEEKIYERICKYAELLGKYPKKIMIRDQQRRWGSCSHSGILRYNWKIIMAPLSVLDYVIVHELCHLIFKNHSEKFWNKLGSIVPDYKKKRQWLKENSFLLAELLSYK